MHSGQNSIQILAFLSATGFKILNEDEAPKHGHGILYEAMKNTEFLNMEFTHHYGIPEILRHEKITGTHVQATQLTGNAWLFNGKKKIPYISGINELSQNL